MRSVAAQGHARRVDRLHRGDRVALDARDLHQAADGIAGEPEVVLHGDLRGVLHLRRRSPRDRAQRPGRHRAGHADFPLAADLRAGDRGILLVENPDGARGEEEIDDPRLVRAGHEAVVVVKHRRDDSRRSVRRRGDHAPAGGVLLVHGQRVQVHPVHHLERVARRGRVVRLQRAKERSRAALHLEASGQDALRPAAALHARPHDAPDPEEIAVDFPVVSPVIFVLSHECGDRTAQPRRDLQKFRAAVELVRQHGRIRGDLLVPCSVRGGLLAHDEAAADGVVGLRVDLGIRGVEGRKAHRIGVERQALASMEHEVARSRRRRSRARRRASDGELSRISASSAGMESTSTRSGS